MGVNFIKEISNIEVIQRIGIEGNIEVIQGKIENMIMIESRTVDIIEIEDMKTTENILETNIRIVTQEIENIHETENIHKKENLEVIQEKENKEVIQKKKKIKEVMPDNGILTLLKRIPDNGINN